MSVKLNFDTFISDTSQHAAASLPGFPQNIFMRDITNPPLENPIDGSEAFIEVHSMISMTKNSNVYRGVLFSLNGSCKVILKFAPHQNLLNEVDSYVKMISIQGVYIPLFYGLFVDSNDTQIDVPCIVLEDCGSPVDDRFRYLDKSQKAKILTALVAIHKCGIKHLDFREVNVSYQADIGYRILDFGLIGEHKECKWTYNFEEAGDHLLYQDLVAMRCGNILNIATEMNFWDEGGVSIKSRICTPKSDYPSQYIIDQLNTGIGWITRDNTEFELMKIFYRKVQEQIIQHGDSLDELKNKARDILHDVKLAWATQKWRERNLPGDLASNWEYAFFLIDLEDGQYDPPKSVQKFEDSGPAQGTS